MHDNIPWWIAVPLAIVLWFFVYKIYIWPKHKVRLEGYFAQRRHDRRVRAKYPRGRRSMAR